MCFREYDRIRRNVSVFGGDGDGFSYGLYGRCDRELGTHVAQSPRDALGVRGRMRRYLRPMPRNAKGDKRELAVRARFDRE